MEIPAIFILLVCCVLLSNNGIEVEASYQENKMPPQDQPYMTSFHFRPPENWLNDPNGPMWYKGVYHLFYQYNPYAAVFGDKMIWAHSISYDLINWIHLDHALQPTEPFDINSCWSGSVTILSGDRPVILYTGIDVNKQQVQNLAVPKNLSDPLLQEWIKFSRNPLMTPPNGIEVDNFRDPTTAWQGPDGKWRVIVGSWRNNQGMAMLYKSDDFVNWTKQEEPLYSTTERTGMWECPDFFPVYINSTDGVDTSFQNPSVKHIMKGSFFGSSHDYYVIGTYNPDMEKYIPDSDFSGSSKDLRYDYGKFYASKTFFDCYKNRRILWAWVNESDSTEDDIKKGWSGLQAIPREIWLDKSGKQLVQRPVEEINKLHGEPVIIMDKVLDSGSVFEVEGITASQADVEIEFELSETEDAETINPTSDDPQLLCDGANASAKGVFGPFGLLALATDNLTEQTAIFFRIFKGLNGYTVLMCSDQSRSSLRDGLDKTTYGAFVDIDPQSKKISLRSLIDHSIVESFGGGGRACITSRVYPKLAIHNQAHLYVFNYGTKKVKISRLNAWSMSNASSGYEESYIQKNEAVQSLCDLPQMSCDEGNGRARWTCKENINRLTMVLAMEMSVVFVFGLYYLLACHGIQAYHHADRNLQSSSAKQPYRTAFHFQPPKNWMNDPNGPMYYKRVYHLFYQYNPYAAVWGNMTWAHSVSCDLVNWVHIDNALYPRQPYDFNGCFSGSTTILPGEKPAILYTGADLKNRQVQNLAVPKNLSDPFLREWVKSPHNPLMTPLDGIGADYFRDPTTAWQGPDKMWRVIVGSQINGHGTAILYRSNDFINWTRSENSLHSSTKTEMWECPDFFPVRINSEKAVENSSQDQFLKHVLKASFNHYDYYILGIYKPETDKFSVETDFMDPGSDLRYDYGKFYASKTFFDSAKQRRILWGWIDESDSESDDVKKGWSGLQSIPRTIALSKNGRQLIQWPIKEIENLRSKLVSFKSKKLKPGSLLEVSGITASQADVEVAFDSINLKKAETLDPRRNDPQLICSQKTASDRGQVGPFGLLVLASEDLTERTAVYFRIFTRNDKYIVLMCSDQSRSSIRYGLDKTTYGAFIDLDPRRENITLRSLIDRSIVESFGGNGRTCVTARVYPKLAIDKHAHLCAFNNGSIPVKILQLSAWSMKNAQIASTNLRRMPNL